MLVISLSPPNLRYVGSSSPFGLLVSAKNSDIGSAHPLASVFLFLNNSLYPVPEQGIKSYLEIEILKLEDGQILYRSS